VLLGRVTPLVRSFVSVTAGVFEVPMRIYAPLTAIGSAVWCFGLAGAGWALGSNLHALDAAFRWVELGVVGVLALVARRRHARA
jgi:membrane protein DedA with SNARE-associated domain